MKDNKIKIVALFGPAGSGKDYLVKKIMSSVYTNTNKVFEIVSQTTRPPRENEKDGIDYFFKDKNEFIKDINEGNLLEWTSFRDWYYGTNLNSLQKNKINIGVFNVEGIRTLLKDNRIEIFPVAITTSPKTRLIRQLSREQNPDIKEIFRRYDADEMDFSFIDFKYTVIRNEDYDNAELQLADFVNSL